MMIFKPNNNFKVVGFDLFGSNKVKLKFKYKIDRKVQTLAQPRNNQPKRFIKKV